MTIFAVDGYTIIILLTLFGFLALAAILLVPVYRFLRREERASRKWMPDEPAAGWPDPVEEDGLLPGDAPAVSEASSVSKRATPPGTD